ncbi:MAG: multicomponent Na+:H+ antiporter subunit E [Natrialbaceae archaeon]|jgi:multicomponent Na+:H+ antiporter subunit E
MKRWPVIGVILAVLWLFVRGVTIEPASVAGEFLIGLAAGLPIAFVFRRMYTADVPIRPVLRGVPAAIVYVVLFVKELLVANLDVAYRVLSPSMPIKPVVILLPLRVEKDIAITTIANSITLTPGTLTMDYDADRNALYVHTLYCDDSENVTGPIRSWEDYALRIFDEDADPSDSPREPVVRWSKDDAIEGQNTTELVEKTQEENASEEAFADESSPGNGGESDGE